VSLSCHNLFLREYTYGKLILKFPALRGNGAGSFGLPKNWACRPYNMIHGKG